MGNPDQHSTHMRHRAIVIRRALVDEAPSLLEFAARTYYEAFAPLNTSENIRAYMAGAFTLPGFIQELNDARAVFIVAEADGKLAGYAKLRSDKSPACVAGEAPIELVRFYIDQPWQGSGLASDLMQSCFSEAKQRGFKTIYLGVWEKNFRAQAFYKKWNFIRVGEHVFQMGDDPQIDWWMMRAL
jgi:ribosomal protein S18 acetylase RimI-like enzyme